MNDMQVIAIIKDDGQQFIFLFDLEQRNVLELLNTAGRYAADPELSFTWADAAVLTTKLNALLPV